MTIKELIEKRAKAWETAKEFVNSHEQANGTLSAEDSETYNRMEKEIEDLTAAIERQQRAERMEKTLEKPTAEPLVTTPQTHSAELRTGRASDEYKAAMLSALRSNFRNVSNVLQEGVDADGGYLVPEESWESPLRREWLFIAISTPQEILFGSLVSVVSVCSEPVYGRVCGQTRK